MREIIFICCAGVLVAACQQTPPMRRAGLWQESIVRDGNPRQTGMMGRVSICLDPTTDGGNPMFNRKLAIAQAKAHNCIAPTTRRDLNGIYAFSSTCPLPSGNGTVVIEGTASGNFQTAYHLHMESTTHYDPPFQALTKHHVDEIDGRWIGACPPNLKPGDMMLANGMVARGGRMIDPHRGLSLQPRPSAASSARPPAPSDKTQ